MKKALILVLILAAGLGLSWLMVDCGRDTRAYRAEIEQLRIQSADAELRANAAEARSAAALEERDRALVVADEAERARKRAEAARRPEVIREQVAALPPSALVTETLMRLGLPAGIENHGGAIVFTLAAARRNAELLRDREGLLDELYSAKTEIIGLREAIDASARALVEKDVAAQKLRKALAAERERGEKIIAQARREKRKLLIYGAAVGLVIGFAAGR